MRKIKFRIWDKRNKKMIYKTNTNKIYMSLDGKLYNGLNGQDFSDDFILMQYTGLKDKNGKEIYEGDIIKSKYFGDFIVKNGIVRIMDNEAYQDNLVSGFYLQQVSSKELWHLDFLKKCEVIGNIYENPELLK